MSRYIDAEKIPYDYTNERGVPMTRQIDIQNVPTADVVEVVRCKDCTRQLICYHSDEYYCADGERR